MPATPAWPPASTPRLFVDLPLGPDAAPMIDGPAAHYLLNVMRMKAGDPIDYSAGIEIFAKTGDYVAKGDVIARLHTSDESLLSGAAAKYAEALSFSDLAPGPEVLIYKTVE